jgi:DNA-binding NarL/FixJ family response regulator
LGDDVTVLDAASVDAALAAIARDPDIDLVLLDISLPGAGGLSLLQELRRERNTVPVIVISGANDRDLVLRALDLGALGFVPKSSPVEVMVQAIRLVLAGGTYIPRQALATPRYAQEAPRQGARAIERLTDRQREILALMAQGKPNKLIADTYISEAPSNRT